VRIKTSASCKFCNADETGRNLILSFDGTSNQYEEKVPFPLLLSGTSVGRIDPTHNLWWFRMNPSHIFKGCFHWYL
jgi:uncharacterized protein (DUF2235 family)